MTLLRTAVGDGAVSEAQSQDIARALDETLNLRMRTAEERRRFMYQGFQMMRSHRGQLHLGMTGCIMGS